MTENRPVWTSSTIDKRNAPSHGCCFSLTLRTIVCSSLFGFSIAGTVYAQESAQIFDRVEVEAVSLGLSVPSWVASLDTRPSKALHDIVASRPKALKVEDSGGRWFILPRKERSFRQLDAEQYPLSESDFEAAVALLQQPWLKKWVNCMEEAVSGQASSECFLELAESAKAFEEEDLKGATVLLANLGARLLSLANINPAWSRLVYVRSVPEPVRNAMTAYEALELEKIQAVFAQTTEGRPPSAEHTSLEIVSAKLGVTDDSSLAWDDFATDSLSRPMEQKGPFVLQIVEWTPGPNRMKPVRLGSHERAASASAITIAVSAEQHVILTTDTQFTLDNVMRIRSANDMKEILVAARDANASVFLSRPGESRIGEVKKGESP